MNESNQEDEPEQLNTIDFRKLAWNSELANNINSIEKLKLYFLRETVFYINILTQL